MLPVVIDGKQIGAVAKTDPLLDGKYTAREQDAFAGAIALEGCFRRYHPEDMPPQERIMLVLRAIGEALNEGKRDQYMENDIMQQYLAFSGGRTAVQRLFAMPDIAEPADS